MSSSSAVRVKIISDRHLEKASRDTGIKLEIQWLPYLLDPNTPKEGEDLLQHLAQKYGSAIVEKFNKPNNPLDMAGRSVGINFNKSRRFINTINGHRLVEWCNQNSPEKSDELMENLFHSYFEEAKDISTTNELIDIAIKVGLNEQSVRDLYQSNELRSEVLELDQKAKQRYRVSGVPYFIVEDSNGGRPVAFSGAQPAEIIAQVLEEAQGN